MISIPALREEGDIYESEEFGYFFDFYPRPPRGGRRSTFLQFNQLFLFLSPPSARRATACHDSQVRLLLISIPALREEGDSSSTGMFSSMRVFLSPPSARRATIVCKVDFTAWNISIPALREEGDASRRKKSRDSPHFYPRPPRGGRRSGYDAADGGRLFLSPPSARRATYRHRPVRP